MSKYSDFFLIGSPEYCELNERMRLRSFGSWLAEEVWCREKQNKKRAQFTLELIRLARKIAKAKGIDEDAAFELLQSGSDDRAEALAEFTEEMEQLMVLSPSGKDQFEELVTLFFKNRGEVMDGKKWVATKDWAVEDTRKLPSNMLTIIDKFMSDEEGTEAMEKEQDEEDEEAPK